MNLDGILLTIGLHRRIESAISFIVDTAAPLPLPNASEAEKKKPLLFLVRQGSEVGHGQEVTGSRTPDRARAEARAQELNAIYRDPFLGKFEEITRARIVEDLVSSPELDAAHPVPAGSSG